MKRTDNMSQSRSSSRVNTPKMPEWLKRPIPRSGKKSSVIHNLSQHNLHTVCQEAKCPNRAECFCRGCATFMILGDVCTRDCAFCSVRTGRPQPPDASEPHRLVESVRQLQLKHVVITSVTRDDLADGGAAHFAAVVRTLHEQLPGVTVEILVPDFGGETGPLATACTCGCDIFNHNVETVPRLYPRARPDAIFERSLDVLSFAATRLGRERIKSGIMVGLGETEDEVVDVLQRLYRAGCDILTIGQYLQPEAGRLPVAEYIHPSQFERYKKLASDIGFSFVYSAPFVRSSYKADEAIQAMHSKHR